MTTQPRRRDSRATYRKMAAIAGAEIETTIKGPPRVVPADSRQRILDTLLCVCGRGIVSLRFIAAKHLPSIKARDKSTCSPHTPGRIPQKALEKRMVVTRFW